MSTFAKNLIFTIEKPEHGLNFLDTTVFCEHNGTLQYTFYRKSTTSDVVQDFHPTITQKKLK